MSEAVPYDYQGPLGSQTPGSQIAGYDPSPEEEKAIKLVNNLFDRAKSNRTNFDQKWLDYYRMFRGKQWKDQRPSYRHAEVINLVFRAIQSDVPILTDRIPRPTFVPVEPGDLPLANVLNDILDSDWTSGSWDQAITEIIYDGHLYGTGLGSLKYDAEASNGAGRIVFRCEDLFCGYPDPYARDVNDYSNYYCHAEAQDVERLKREYPDFARFIKPDLVDLNRKDGTGSSDYSRQLNTSTNRAILDSSNSNSAWGSSDTKGKNEALKIELYIHDTEYCEDEGKERDEKTGEEKSIYIQRLKYPNGRHLVVVNGVLCENGPIEYEDKKFPYLRWVNYILPREFYGISEVEQLESPQKVFNKLVSFSLDVLTLMGNPVWIVDSTSGVDTDNLFNRPGLIVEKEPGSEVRREEGVQLQPYVLQLIDRMKLWFDDISGSNDVSRGAKPEGVTAASAIQALQEAAQTRLRQKTRNTDAFLQQFGKMYISRVFQYYDAPRIFRVTGDDNSTRYFKFHVEKQPVMDEMGQPTGETNTIAKIRPYAQGADGQMYPDQEQSFQVQGEFDIKVGTGSSLPFEKDRIEQQSYNLFDRQIIDAEEVLRNLKYPNAEAVLKRQAEKAAMAAQEQQDAMMAKEMAKVSAPA